MKYNANDLLEICFRTIDITRLTSRAYAEEQNKTVNISTSYAWGYNSGLSSMLNDFRNDLDSGKLSDARMEMYEKDYEMSKASNPIKKASDRGYYDGYRDSLRFVKMLYDSWDKKPYYLGPDGIRFYLDPRMQPVKELPEGETELKVISVHQRERNISILTIDEGEGPIAYAFPEGIEEWAMHMMNRPDDNEQLPAKCLFIRNGDEYTVKVL